MFRRWAIGLLVLFFALCVFASVPTQAQDCSELRTAQAFFDRANTAYDNFLFADTVADATCAIQLDPNNAEYYNKRGQAYYLLGESAKARADFSKALELDDTLYYAHNNLANLYYDIGDYDAALEGYNRALNVSESVMEREANGFSIIYSNRAGIFSQRGDYARAIADLEKSLELDRYNAPSYLFLGEVYAKQGKVVEAAEMYYEYIYAYVESMPVKPYTANRSYEVRLRNREAIEVILFLNAGDVLNVAAAVTDRTQRADPLLVLLDSFRNPIIADDDSGINANAVISDFVAPISGDYFLILSNGYSYSQTGVDGLINLSIQQTRNNTAVINSTPTPSTTGATPVSPPEEGTALEAGAFASYRLLVNDIAQIYTTKGDRLNLRAQPGLSSDILAKLDKGTLVTLLEGPRKEDGLQWWRIRTPEGLEGWSVERVDEEQTLRMALIVGEDVIVTTDGERLNVRETPSTSGTRLFQIEDGTRATLLEGPVIANNFAWWRVRLSDGRMGWVVDQIDGLRTIIPAKERD
jgi:tetratricopeptide (TPR) repeat protein/uncharacterized protein YgiM (DUF1202 family)